MTRITLALALLFGCAPLELAQEDTDTSGLTAGSVSFQNGVSGYSGTRDVSISNHYGGNGVTSLDGKLMAWKLTGSNAYEARALVRFDSLSLPAGATITGATLTLTFDNWTSGFTLAGYYLNADWNAGSTALGWLNRDVNTPWSTPGGGVVSGKSFSIGGFAGTGAEEKTVALDPAIVQEWLSSKNRGVLLVNQNNDKVTRIYSAEEATVARRPKLTIQYTVGGDSCDSASAGPAFVNLPIAAQPGSFTARFDATPSAILDALVGLSSGAASAYTGLAAIVRFNPDGKIDARNGSAYAAATSIPYQGNATYAFRLVVDVPQHRYSVYVTPPGQSELLVGADYAFRTEQASLTLLDNRSLKVASAAGTLRVCNFNLSTTGDPIAPSVTLTQPQNGATLSGAVTLAASASDNVGVAGVQFLVDGASSGAEVTSAPYTLTLSPLPNGSHTFAARARDAAGNQTTSATVTATVNNPTPPPPSGNHPRIFLDVATLTSLQKKAQSGSAQWTTLRNACNSYLAGTVQYPDGNDYPNLPNIGEGYQGSEYFNPLMNIGLCYQIGLGINDPNTTQWGQKGADILEKMSNPSHSPPFSRDHGYGIRFFGAGMALGYDWLYGALSSSLRAQIGSQLNGWISFFDQSGFENDFPHGNYFAGYYAAKAYAGLATEGDNPNAGTLWGDFLNRLHYGGANAVGGHTGVQAYYARYMGGGGWSEGWGYGPLAAINMSLPSLAARTAKALDLIGDANRPYSYPLDNGMHLMQFAWPSLTSLDDRDLLHQGADIPAAPNSNTSVVTAALMSRWSHPLAPQFHAWARAIRARQGAAPPWSEFLFWDDGAPEQPYTTLPLSYLSRGLNAVAMRSDWGSDATWASFRASAYVDYGGAAEQGFDAGSLAIVRGATPFVLNPTGFLVTSFPGTQSYENLMYDELLGSNAQRRFYNIFFNGPSGQIYVPVDGSPAPGTRVARYEDGGGYVLVRAEDLQDVYRATSAVSSWTREVVYLRPSRFVVYDRTNVSAISDEHLNWHVIFTPSSAQAPSGSVRWNVTNPTAGFMGAVTTVLPQSAQVSSVNVFNSNKVYRLEVRAPSPANDMRWMTVLDAASSAAAVAPASKLNSSANVSGTLLTSASGNAAVLFGVAPSISGNVSFSVPAADTRVVVADLAASTSYAVSVITSGGTHSVTIQPGSGFTSTANGTLHLAVSAAGGVTRGQ